MSALDLFTYTAWTLASPSGACSMKVDRTTVEWCVTDECSPVQEVSAPAPGRWVLLPQDIEVTWTDWASATVPCDSTPTALSVRWDMKSQSTAPGVPRQKVNAVLGLPVDSVVPGRWSSATRECVAGSEAWSFAPFGSKAAVYVAREADGWRVEPMTTGIPVMCPGGRLGGLYPPSTDDRRK